MTTTTPAEPFVRTYSVMKDESLTEQQGHVLLRIRSLTQQVADLTGRIATTAAGDLDSLLKGQMTHVSGMSQDVTSLTEKRATLQTWVETAAMLQIPAEKINAVFRQGVNRELA